MCEDPGVRRLLLLLLACGGLAARPAAGGEDDRPRGAPPIENTSYVPDDGEALRREMAAAEDAARRGDWGPAVRALQRVVEGPPEAVWAAGESGVCEGAAVAAHLRVAALGRAAMDAYEEETGTRATDLLAAGVARRDPAQIARVADLYLPSLGGRRAALLLADLGVLAVLLDAPEPDTLREGGRGPRAGRVAPGRRPVPRVRGIEKYREDTEVGPEADEPGKGLAARPSPWLPPRAVVAAGRAYISDGRDLRVHDLGTGRLLSSTPLRRGGAVVGGAGERGAAARHRWGWMEGHGLTVAGDVVWVHVAATREPRVSEGEEPLAEPLEPRRPGTNRGDHVVAIRVGALGGRRLWEAGGHAPTPGLPEGLGLHGTPLLYAGALHVAGLRVTKASKERFEAWHVALDPATGAVRSATFLGTGGPLRRGRDEEVVPSSCAAARGRVVLVTATGIAAAVDARTGRVQWSFRYDRGRPDGDEVGRRLVDAAETPGRASSLSNQPPRLWDDRAVIAPTDSRTIVGLFDRPRGRRRLLRAWSVHRTDAFHDMAAEQVAGLAPARDGVPATLVVVGQGYPVDANAVTWTCVAGLDPYTGELRWARPLPFGREPEPFGEALVARDEVLVPTANGIARYALADGSDRPALDASSVPAARLHRLREEEMLYGNLIPVPGKGFLAVHADGVAFWLREEP